MEMMFLKVIATMQGKSQASPGDFSTPSGEIANFILSGISYSHRYKESQGYSASPMSGR
jgi:hypothetical protein